MSRVADKLIKAKTDSGFTPDPDFTKLLTTGGATGTTLLNDLDDASQIDYFSNSAFGFNTSFGANMYTAVDDTNKVFMVTNRNSDRLAVADWSDDTNIVAADIVTDSVRLDNVTQVAVDPSKEFAYTTNYNSTSADRGHCRYDYSDPTNVTLKWFLQYSSTTYGLTVNPSRELLYYFTANGLRTMDISPTGTNVMVFKDFLNLGQSVAAYVQDTFLDIENDILYAVTHTDRIMAIDVSTDTAAVLLDSLVDNTNLDQIYAVSVDVAAGIAFVITRYGKISSIDVSDPSNLALLDTYTGVGYSNDQYRRSMTIDAGAKRVFTSYGNGFSPTGVKVIEYSDPSNLTLETTIDHNSGAYKGAKVHLYN